MFVSLLLSLVISLPGAGYPDGELSRNKIFKSDALGYDLHYRVYTPGGYDGLSDLPILYTTDGQWYIQSGKVHEVMDQLIDSEVIEPAIVVFIDNRDPYNPNNNRRNSQFFCNQDYIDFVSDELVPYIDREYSTSADREDRVMLGLSFGGLNSACFGLHASDAFKGIAMQSPAIHPVPSIPKSYKEAKDLDLKVFLSSGTVRDNLEQTRKFKNALDRSGIELSYVEVEQSHNWANWGPLIDDVLVYFFG